MVPDAVCKGHGRRFLKKDEVEVNGEKWVIYWNEHASDAYTFGSRIVYHKRDDVEFENELMPPGTVIKTWYSKTNFQVQKLEPSLPLIDGEGEYEITVRIDCEEAGGCLVRLVFYDRYEIEAGSLTVRGKSARFRCPLKTYSYQMQLVNGGVTRLHFHSITIREIMHDE